MGRKFTIFALFYFVFEGKFQVQAAPGGRGGLYSEGGFNGGFFCVTILGGLYLGGLIHGGAYFRNFKVCCGSILFSFVSKHFIIHYQLPKNINTKDKIEPQHIHHHHQYSENDQMHITMKLLEEY